MNNVFIVANNRIIKYFKTIQGFEIDLGFNLKGAVSTTHKPEGYIKIRDTFIKKYENINNRIINKVAKYKFVSFYEDLRMKYDEFHIYDDDDNIFEIKLDEFKDNAEEYLMKLIYNIYNPNKEVVEEEKIIKEDVKVIHTTAPDEFERPDMNLPKDEYIAQMVKKRQMLWEKNNQKEIIEKKLKINN